MFKMELQWKEINVDLTALDQQLRQDHEHYTGNQAQTSRLELWFTQEPSQQAKADIQSLWASIDEDHALAKSYKSASAVEADKEAKKASAMAKLQALGLSEAEVKAILG